MSPSNTPRHLESQAPLSERRVSRILLGVLLVVLALLVTRLAVYVVTFQQSSLQMDFAAFYTAGQSVAAGLSPYLNHVAHDPPIWDGVNRYAHSRFLYPPIVADAFRLLTVMPYHLAKLVWMLASLAAFGASLWIVWRGIADRLPAAQAVALACLAAGFFPTLTLLERGQVDAFTLLLLAGTVAWAGRGGRRGGLAGVLLAAATVLKLHCVFVLPFLVLRRRWAELAGFAAGAAALICAGLVIDGPVLWHDYAFRQLPRISRYGEGGPRAMLLPAEDFRRVTQGVPAGSTTMGGRAYRPEALEFVLNASLVRTPLGKTIWNGMRSTGLRVAPAYVALALLAVCFVGFAVGGLRDGPRDVARSPWADTAYRQAVLVVVLLCAPVTWAMNTVWLLPVGALALLAWREVAWPWVGLCCAGLLIAGVPDRWTGLLLAPAGEFWPQARYIIAELLCLAGLVGLWRGGPRGDGGRLRAASGAADPGSGA